MDQQLSPNIQQEQPNPQPQKPPNKPWQIAVLVVAGILVMGGVSYGAYYFWQKQANKPIVCTQEAKQCPDGSYVSRTGENCEFALCPDETAGWQTYRNEEYGFELKYPKEWVEAPIINENQPVTTNCYSYGSGIQFCESNNLNNAQLSLELIKWTKLPTQEEGEAEPLEESIPHWWDTKEGFITLRESFDKQILPADWAADGWELIKISEIDGAKVINYKPPFETFHIEATFFMNNTRIQMRSVLPVDLFIITDYEIDYERNLKQLKNIRDDIFPNQESRKVVDTFNKILSTFKFTK